VRDSTTTGRVSSTLKYCFSNNSKQSKHRCHNESGVCNRYNCSPMCWLAKFCMHSRTRVITSA